MRTGFFLFITLWSIHIKGQVKSPQDFLGFELGSQFTRHHQVVDYFQHVSDKSEAVIISGYGKTYEKRPLYLAFVSSPENLKNLEQIREDNLKRAGIIRGQPVTDKVIVWLSYNVHGNESVSTEASMATLYELVKPDSDKSKWLEEVVVVIDPCVNPDGRERYVNFYFQYGAQPYNASPVSWEHHEAWPSGRPNHYLFDLNRDWAWQTQKESQQRIAVYNQWLPHVHVDFHEQGVNEPYYFAPAAKPIHELITAWQREFQTQIGKNNAKYFDENNWFYFTKQYFDLMYPSYGDTYPTYNGSIGMTYEQGGSGRAGLGVLKEEGDTLTLVERIMHHYTSGLSTIEVAFQNRSKVLTEFENFFSATPKTTYQSYVLKYEGNAHLFKQLKIWLDRQGIEYGQTSSDRSLSGYHYSSGKQEKFTLQKEDLLLNLEQPKWVLTSVLFQPKANFEDSLTYDITAWSVPYAYGIDAYALTSTITAEKIPEEPSLTFSYPDAIGFIFPWESIQDAKVLSYLLKQEVKVRFTTKSLSSHGKNFGRGSLLVTRRDNPGMDFTDLISAASNAYDREAYPIQSGWMEAGPDLGSGDIRFIHAPKVALIGGSGTSSTDVGATWHFFEQELGYALNLVSTDYFSSVDLDEFDVLIMQNGWYHDFDDKILGKISS